MADRYEVFPYRNCSSVLGRRSIIYYTAYTYGEVFEVDNRAELPKKEIFLYPLTPDFRDSLCFDSS